MSRKLQKYIRFGLSSLAAILFFTGLAPVSMAKPKNIVTKERVQSFFDQRIPELLKEQKVPGASVTVVSPEGELFSSGYGYANLEQGELVDASKTIFHTASVAKTFTTIGILKLVEEGKLDLHTDVNTYLPKEARIPETFPKQPITLYHILTQTTGFSDVVHGWSAPSADKVLSPKQNIIQNQPKRIYPPGKFISYSNYGFDLAGYIVENVTSLPFEDYMNKDVFKPIGMTQTFFTRSGKIPSQFSPPATYKIINGKNQLFPPEYLNFMASVQAMTTARDMGRFLRMLLNDGSLDGHRILTSKSVKAMLSRHEGNHPKLTGVGYGTWEGRGDGPQWFWHSGDNAGSHAKYALIPEQGIGIYVTVNGDGDPRNIFSAVCDIIMNDFLSEFTDINLSPKPVGSSVKNIESYVGQYVTTRRPEGEPFKLIQVLMDRVSVSLENGVLYTKTSHPMLPDESWVPVGDNLFATQDGSDHLGFIRKSGKIVGLSFNSNPTQVYELEKWYLSPMVLLSIAGGALFIMLSIVLWPVNHVRRKRRNTLPQTAWDQIIARWLATLTVAIIFGYLGYTIYTFSDPMMLERIPLALQILPLTSAVPLACSLVVFSVIAWRKGWWSRLERLHYSAVAISCFAFLGVSSQYGLMWLP